MDIYEYAKSIGFGADYYDFHSGRTYQITEAKNHNGLIPVLEDGVFIGFAKKEGDD